MPSKTRMLTVGIFGIMAVMLLTAAIHLIAPYAAAFTVLTLIFVVSTRFGTRKKDTEPENLTEISRKPGKSWADWPE